MNNCFDAESFIEKVYVPSQKPYRYTVGGYRLTIDYHNYVSFKHMLSNNIHRHNNYEICLCLYGQGRFIHNKESFNISEGTIFIAEPYLFHEIQSSQDSALYLFFFGLRIEKVTGEQEVSVVGDFMHRHRTVVEHCQDLFHYLPLIDREIKKSRLDLSDKLLELLSLDMIERFIGSSEVDRVHMARMREVVIQADAYVSENLAAKITVEDVAKECYVSSRHLQRIVKEQFHQSVGKWILDKKLHAACSQLKNGQSVKEVAKMFGFIDPNYFSVAFKKKYGIPPSIYK